MLGFQRYLFVFSIFKIKTLHWDKKEKDFFFFVELLKGSNGVVIDIGANIGIMTYHLSKELPNATIHAVEPMPDNIEVLRKICERYKLRRVNIHSIALGDSAGKLKMILPENSKTKMQGLSHVKHESMNEWNEGSEFEVEANTLDSLFENQAITGIKIDVENYEYYVFQGGLNLLAKSKPIIYAELWENENREKCFDLLHNLGYHTYVVCRKTLVSYDKNVHASQNFIFKVGALN